MLALSFDSSDQSLSSDADGSSSIAGSASGSSEDSGWGAGDATWKELHRLLRPSPAARSSWRLQRWDWEGAKNGVPVVRTRQRSSTLDSGSCGDDFGFGFGFDLADNS
jgi:hypothetical protein